MKTKVKDKLKELLQQDFNAIDWHSEYIYQEAPILITTALELGFKRLAKDFIQDAKHEGYEYKGLL
jgi:hypothetical protein